MTRPENGKKQQQLLDLTIPTRCSDRVHGIRTRYLPMLRRTLLSALAALAIAAPASAQHGRDDDKRGNPFQGRDGFPSSQWDQSHQERAPQREVPLGSVLRDLKGRYGGQHLDAQKVGDRYIISWITGDGRRLTIEVDATTGRVLSTR